MHIGIVKIGVNRFSLLLQKGKITDSEIQLLNSCISAIKLKSTTELKQIVAIYINRYNNDSLNWLDVSEINDMSSLFYIDAVFKNNYNGDISIWDVSNVIYMTNMFRNTTFN